MDRNDRRAAGMALGLGTMGVLHFVAPEPFDRMIPRWMPGSPRTWTYLSGVAELIGAALVVPRRTRRLGGWWCAATIAGVYPANIQAALDGGMAELPPPFNSAAVAWARLPLQFPMIAQAIRIARAG